MRNIEKKRFAAHASAMRRPFLLRACSSEYYIRRESCDEGGDTNDYVFIPNFTVTQCFVMPFVSMIVPIVYDPGCKGGGFPQQRFRQCH